MPIRFIWFQKFCADSAAGSVGSRRFKAVSRYQPANWSLLEGETARLMAAGMPAIFQATFVADGFVINCDVLTPGAQSGTWDVYEIKGLREYCKLDTYAMWKIWRVLREKVS